MEALRYLLRYGVASDRSLWGSATSSCRTERRKFNEPSPREFSPTSFVVLDSWSLARHPATREPVPRTSPGLRVILCPAPFRDPSLGVPKFNRRSARFSASEMRADKLPPRADRGWAVLGPDEESTRDEDVRAVLDGLVAPGATRALDECLVTLKVAGEKLGSLTQFVSPLTASTTLEPARRTVEGLTNFLGLRIAFIEYETEKITRPRFGEIIDPIELLALSALIGKAQNFELSQADPEPQVIDFAHELTKHIESFEEGSLSRALDNLDRARQFLGDERLNISDSLVDAITARRVQRLENLEGRAQRSFENLQLAARATGKALLSETFSGLAAEEAESAFKWNLLVVLFVTLGISLPLAAIWAEERFLPEIEGVTGVLTKALIAVPLLAMATYSGKISASHRRVSQHMRVLAAQVDSVRAYVDGLPSEIQNEVMLTLGRNAYSDPGFTNPDGAVGVPPEQIMPALEKAVDALKEIRK